MSRARTFADLASASEAGSLASPNIVVNGDMSVAQRGTSATTNTGYQTVDRFQTGTSGVDESPSQEQADVSSGTTPYTLGFKKSYKITNGNQTGGASAGDIIDVKYRFEAQDVATSGWNFKSSSSFVTLSFWVKSSVAQNFFAHIITLDGTQYNFPFSTGTLTADTWTKVTKTILGNSNLTINNDNGNGLEIRWGLFYGTDRTASVSEDTWVAYNNTQRTPDNTSTWYTTNDATFELTGVQLEVGQVATPFKHESFADNLARCQRYFYAPVHKGTASSYFGTGFYYNSSLMLGFLHHKVEMRANPTLTSSTGTGDFALLRSGATDAVDDFALNSTNTLGTSIINNSDASGTAGDAGGLYIVDATNAFLHLSAEL